MTISEITDESGNVCQLKISGATAEEARDAAYHWCEDNNCLLGKVTQNENVFIAAVCSDDYK